MSETGLALGRQARAGMLTGLTVGRARGFVQANLFVLPGEAAPEFVAFCDANPAACPVLAVGAPGDPRLPALGEDLDVRTDLPACLLHGSGTPEPRDNLLGCWRDDWVAVAIGCWFGAEAALASAGIRLRHVEQGVQGPLFRSALPAIPAGRFAGALVVSMRPFLAEQADRATAITARLPRSHGAPLYRGSPEALGITDPGQPDWGEALPLEAGEVALYWGCGLTALAALQQAGLAGFATHAPGAMLVTDLPEETPPCP